MGGHPSLGRPTDRPPRVRRRGDVVSTLRFLLSLDIRDITLPSLRASYSNMQYPAWPSVASSTMTLGQNMTSLASSGDGGGRSAGSVRGSHRRGAPVVASVVVHLVLRRPSSSPTTSTTRTTGLLSTAALRPAGDASYGGRSRRYSSTKLSFSARASASARRSSNAGSVYATKPVSLLFGATNDSAMFRAPGGPMTRPEWPTRRRMRRARGATWCDTSAGNIAFIRRDVEFSTSTTSVGIVEKKEF
mmetsp:Transcript_14124/g.56297  ORF Transcript_14124/g.56297 Transcript_14124/m.56297 type:complete len:246 (+) Transcript_14124:1918-2655(+)